MLTKKVVSKKPAAPKPAPKLVPAKSVKKSKVEKNVIIAEAKVELVSFAVTAVIPTQQYGNIQPRIEVSAPSFEEARAFVMPLIEDLYKTYAESKLGFLGKITEEVKQVVPAPQVQNAPAAQVEVPAEHGSDAAAYEGSGLEKPKSAAVLAAEKAISLAMSEEAMLVIQGQVEKSVKITPEEKPALITLCLKKRNEFK